ncbi:hypothetical protein BD410DRAFT_810000 [Rickenella mellea]|uniref:Fungal calcium binding protein domain-containing protein n=1 Tax=Rickenella mellea TaxID=50990 RepID=A0A4Y7PGD2_9AGAM|nr:hypothetical protein BD410DRAFT_810000 [Rickenella mellea]
MKLIIAILSLAITLPVFAIPTPVEQPVCDRRRLLRKRCNITGCIVSVAFTSLACAAAAAEEGLNPVADAHCLIALGETIDKFSECSSCFPDPVTSIDSILSEIEDFLNEEDDGGDPGDGDGGFGGGDGGGGGGGGGC